MSGARFTVLDFTTPLNLKHKLIRLMLIPHATKRTEQIIKYVADLNHALNEYSQHQDEFLSNTRIKAHWLNQNTQTIIKIANANLTEAELQKQLDALPEAATLELYDQIPLPAEYLKQFSKYVNGTLLEQDFIDNSAIFIELYKISYLKNIKTNKTLPEIEEQSISHACILYLIFHYQQHLETSAIEISLNNLLLKYYSQSQQALNDYLQDIAVPKTTTPFLAQWLAMIKGTDTYKIKIYFNRAAEIDAWIITQDMHFSMANIKLAVATHKYAHADTYPEFSAIAARYQMTGPRYLQTLDYINSRTQKETCLLPNIIIDGATVARKIQGFADDYYFALLDKNDPTLFAVGDILGICLAIDGKGWSCTLCADTLPTHGFYVLLKRTNKLCTKDTVFKQTPQGIRINHDMVMVVGMSYAWLGEHGLVLDSCEDLKTVPSDVSFAMRKAFARRACEENPAIPRVRLGIGGRTPDGYMLSTMNFPKCTPYEGAPYRDSLYQSELYANPQFFNDSLYRAQLKPILLEMIGQACQNHQILLGLCDDFAHNPLIAAMKEDADFPREILHAARYDLEIFMNLIFSSLSSPIEISDEFIVEMLTHYPCTQVPKIIEFDARYANNKAIVLIAINQYHCGWEFVGEELQKDTDVITAVVNTHGLKYFRERNTSAITPSETMTQHLS